MRRMVRPGGVVAAAVLAAVATSCGGGGGGDDGSTSPPVVAPPPPQFSNATRSSGIAFVHGVVNPTNSKAELFGGGVASGDYDGDGDIDLYVVRGNIGPNLLYRNDGGGRFTNVAEAAGVAHATATGKGYLHSGPAFADLDGDGDLDLFVGGMSGDPCLLYENNGDGTFSDVTAQSGIGTMGATNTISAAFGDYDLDGDLDVMLAHWGTPRPPDGGGGHGDTESLWRNDSDANGIHFTNVSVESGVAATIIAGRGGYHEFQPAALDYDYTFTPTFARMNADRYPDILSVADFNNSRVFINNGVSAPVTFHDATNTDVVIDRNGMGAAVGDIDNDGDLDWFMTGLFGTSETVGNRLYLNDGTGQLQDATVSAGVQDGGWGWGACFADFNLDGRLDIFHTNGWVAQNPIDNFDHDRSRLFIARSTGLTFVDEASARGMTDIEQGRGVVCADFDNDGDVDIFMTNRGLENSGALWINDDRVSTNASLSVRLVGRAPNTEAAGARIRVTVGGSTQMREVAIGNNFTSQNPTTQVFGLGAASSATAVEIEWPDGSVDTYSNVAAGRVVFQE
jgi:hypothetical protein